jgi:hypothetical protein
MNSTRIKTFAILTIALLAAPTSAFAASSTDSGYSPPGGDPQLAFTGRDLYLWGGLGLLLVGVGLGLRRLTMPTDEEKRRRAEVGAGGGRDSDYGSTEVALPEPGGEPAPTVAAGPSVTVPVESSPAVAASAAGVSGGAEPTVSAESVPFAATRVEPMPRREVHAARLEAARDRDAAPAPAAAAVAAPASVAVVRPRDRSRLALEHGVAQALVEAGDERGLFEAAAAHVAGALDAEGGAVLSRRDDGNGPSVLARAGSTGQGIDRRDGAADAALTEGRVVRRGTDAGHELAAPIRVDGRVWGVVAVEAPASFTEGDSELAGALAAQVGQALTAMWAVRDADGDVFAARKLAGATDEPGDARLAEYREIARLAMTVGSKLGVPDSRLKTLYIAGLFHDLGLAGVPHELTTRARRLTDEERRVVDQHPLTGARMMRQSPRLRDAAEIVRHLGEHYDGTGIPEGLSGASIPLESRILAAAVAYSSLDSDTAPLVLRTARGTQFDPDVVDAVLETAPAPVAVLA